MTFSAWPEACVSRYMPLTKASITVNKATTMVKARAVMAVVFHRTVRLRKLYRRGTLPSDSKATSSTAAAPARIKMTT